MSSSFLIHPSSVQGRLSLPSSKSQTLRALLFASLAEGESQIHQVLDCQDSDAMIGACRRLGARLKWDKDALLIQGIAGQVPADIGEIYAGNSGIVLRFLTAIAALSAQPILIDGDPSLCKQRRIDALVNALSQGAVRVDYLGKAAYAPLRIQGPLKGGNFRIHGQDSQPVSALLLAAALCPGRHKIQVEDAGERPWVDLTIDWLHRHGCQVEAQSGDSYLLEGGWVPQAFEYTVAGDLSTLAFPVAAALIAGKSLDLHNVKLSDPQGDKRFLDIIHSMGAHFTYDAVQNTVHVQGPAALHGTSIDVNSCIDSLPILATLGCYAQGETRLYNAAVARGKECDRISSMAVELKRMGAHIQEMPDGLVIQGQTGLHGAEMHSHGDHRTAMALSVAALAAKGPSRILDSHCVAKTYGQFAQDLAQLGVQIEVIP